MPFEDCFLEKVYRVGWGEIFKTTACQGLNIVLKNFKIPTLIVARGLGDLSSVTCPLSLVTCPLFNLSRFSV